MSRAAFRGFCLGALLLAPRATQAQLSEPAFLVAANSVVIGPVTSVRADGLGATVVVDTADGKFALTVFSDGRLTNEVENSLPHELFYSGTGCTGTAYVFSSFLTFQPLTEVAVNRQTGDIYIGGPVRGSNIPYQSFLREDGTCTNSATTLSHGRELAATLNFNTTFPAPRHLQFAPQGLTGSVPAVSPLGLAVLATLLALASLRLLRRRRA
ncbi:MAG TPA: hypothetical protein PK413_18345 [Thermoanaerobaculia bacterium]|nr:hypothetical protein [Thermoanaerobaculia bacterium]